MCPNVGDKEAVTTIKEVMAQVQEFYDQWGDVNDEDKGTEATKDSPARKEEPIETVEENKQSAEELKLTLTEQLNKELKRLTMCKLQELKGINCL